MARVCIGTSNGSCPWHEEVNGNWRKQRCDECQAKARLISKREYGKRAGISRTKAEAQEDIRRARELEGDIVTLKDIDRFINRLSAMAS